MNRPLIRPLAGLAAACALASCAHKAPAPVAIAAPPPPIPPRPEVPMVLSAVEVPPHAPDGGYQTIDHGIDAEQAVWHLRAALNVAAIACRGSDGPQIVNAYNAMLKADAAPLAAANDAGKALYRAQFGAGWQSAHDSYMTRLYNYFALPPAKPAFCAAAAALAPRVTMVAPADFVAFAQGALAELDAPITDVFAKVEGYRLASAQWDRRHGGHTELAAETDAPAPAPVQMAAANAAPRLGYADLGTVVNWQPPARPLLALVTR